MILTWWNVFDFSDSAIVIDLLSIERNHLLVRTNVIGGPTERLLPPHTLLKDGSDPYPWPLFSTLPVPKEYTPSVTRSPSSKQGTFYSIEHATPIPILYCCNIQSVYISSI